MADGFSRPPGTPPSLRVALFSGNYNYTLDGASKSLNRLVDHLQTAAGARVRIYAPTTSTPAFPPVGDLISAPSAPIPTRPDYRLALGLTPALRRNLDRFRPDIVHVSAPDLLGLGALKYARDRGLPVVASVHTHFDTYLHYYALGWLGPFLRRRLWAFYSACDYVLTPTAAMAEAFQVEALPARLRVWGRGVDPALFHPGRRSESWRRSQGLAGPRPTVVFMGRIVLEKGLAVFAETIQRLEQSLGPTPVLVIGDGPARAWFQARLPRAVFTGFLQGETLATALASGDIFFNPSATETLGNVNLEAMASGLAMVCADTPNSRALLPEGVSAALCDAADPDAYRAALQRLIEAPDERRRLQAAALARSRSYRWPEILQAVADVYGEAVAAKASGSPLRELQADRL